MKKISTLIVAALVLIFLFTGCNHKHSALHGIYYGYYSNRDPNEFYTLAFSQEHPDQVAVRKKLDALASNSVFNVDYLKSSLIVYTPEEKITLRISKDSLTLSCPSCDGVNGPEAYTYAEDHGVLFPASIGDIAYKEIAGEAKASGLYLPH